MIFLYGKISPKSRVNPVSTARATHERSPCYIAVTEQTCPCRAYLSARSVFTTPIDIKQALALECEVMWQHARAPMHMVEDGVFRQVHTGIYRSNSIATSANKQDKDHAVQHTICVGVAAPLHMFESLDEYRRGSHENPPCYPLDDESSDTSSTKILVFPALRRRSMAGAV